MRQWLLAVLLCSVLLAVQAQPTDDADAGPDWYRIELIIYANRDPQAAVSESWPLLPELAYPNILRRVHALPNRVPAQRDLEPVLFDSLRPAPDYDLAWDTPAEQLLYDYRQSLVLRQPNIELEPLFDLDIPTTFTQLPVAELEFYSRRKRLDRSRDIEVLVHQAWLQPVHDRDNSVPLHIDSQPVSGDFPELQGSIVIYRARYLHLETNLWLNTNGSYLATPWTMPLPPLPPPDADGPVPMSRFEIAPSPQWLALPAGAVAAAPADSEPAPPRSEEMWQALLDRPDYRYRHAVLMQQRRRMRSGELHFVDHPMFGLLIKLSRYRFQAFVQEPDGPTSGSAGRR